MNKKFNLQTNNLINAIIYCVIGVLFIVLRGSLLKIMMTIIGALFIVGGIFNLIEKDYKSFAISLVLGIVLIVGGWTFIDVLLILFGALICIQGIINLIESIQFKDVFKIITSATTIVIGGLLILSNWFKGTVLDVFFIIIGITFIIDGIFALLGIKSIIIKK